MSKIEIVKSISVILEEKKYKLLESEKGYIIIHELDSEIVEDIIYYWNMEYISKFEYSSKLYEALIIKNTDFDLVKGLFHFITELCKSLPNSIDDLKTFSRKLVRPLTIMEKRGIFAEMYCILEYNLCPKMNDNSIYDMMDIESKNDVEIKSFSKVKRNVNISYQQLTNNNNAKFYFIEVFETLEGNNLFEMYNKLPEKYRQRFYAYEPYFFHDDSDKFDTTNSPIIKLASDLNKNLVLPEKCINASFTFNVNNLD